MRFKRAGSDYAYRYYMFYIKKSIVMQLAFLHLYDKIYKYSKEDLGEYSFNTKPCRFLKRKNIVLSQHKNTNKYAQFIIYIL